jgi:hypothetical protein
VISLSASAWLGCSNSDKTSSEDIKVFKGQNLTPEARARMAELVAHASHGAPPPGRQVGVKHQ